MKQNEIVVKDFPFRLAARLARRAFLIFAIASAIPAHSQTLINALEIPGDATDLFPETGPNKNRLGSFASDLAYDREANLWYGLADRGPGGGVIPFNTRLEKFRLDVDPKLGTISNFRIVETLPFRLDKSSALDGRNPDVLAAAAGQLGRSFDPEGLALATNQLGECYVSDEYGPSIYRFKSGKDLSPGEGSGEAYLLQSGTLEVPMNLLPRDDSGKLNYLASKTSKPELKSGRAPNRGLEGLALTPDGKKLYAVLQSPLAEEGPKADGERGRYVRIVEFDTTTGKATHQLLYELEAVDEINRRIADKEGHFKPKKRGRAVGISALLALDDNRLLVLERDNRGIGIDNPTGENPELKHVGSKRIYQIDLSAATDASQTSLANLEELPSHIRPVSKKMFLDLQQALEAKGLSIPEKIEGVAIGQRLADGDYLLLVGTDNDFSVTQTKGAVQYNVYTDGTQGPLDGNADGRKLLPTWLYAFKVSLPGLTD